MKIQCPQCKQTIPPRQVNMEKDMAFCPACEEGFTISESVQAQSVDREVLADPPSGAWFRKEFDRIVVGASTRSPIAFFLVPFMCVWSGGSLAGIYGSQIAEGEFDLTLSLFGIPFVIGSIIFWTVTLMAICGKVEVSIGKCSSLFIGIGSLGWKRDFDWWYVETIREDTAGYSYPGGHGQSIVMEGSRRYKFGTGLNEERHYFLLQALKYLKAQSDQQREQDPSTIPPPV